MSGETDTNPLELSDEDFLKQGAPPVAAASGAETVSEEDGANAGADTGTDADAGASGAEGGDAADAGAADGDAGTAGSDGEGSGEAGGNDGAAADGTGATNPTGADAAGDKGAVDPKAKVEPAKDPKDGKAAEGDGATGSKTFSVPTSIKANGKEIVLKNEQEAVQLMQMGANYTRKLQELAPHRKSLIMLQDNKIDEAKLSFLIDLDKKNPEAIKKLIKDAGIDPLEIDTSVDPLYIAGSHAVTDAEAGFRTVMEDVTSTPAGKETVQAVATWDQASKDAVWQQPELLRAFHEQRENGVFDVISTEVERRVALGAIPVGTPFIQSYLSVGDEMATAARTAAGQSADGAQPGTTGVAPQGQPKVVATRTAEPKVTVTNGDKAAAASPTRTSPTSPKPVINVLAQSDDEFMKSISSRL